MFIGGQFTHVSAGPSGGNVVAVQNLAAIDMSTGEGIASFHPAVTGNAHQDAQVQSLAIVGDVLYVGGQFAAVDGLAHYNIAAIDIHQGTLTGTVDGSFDPSVGSPGAADEGMFYTYRILRGSSGLFIGGVFGKVDGDVRVNAAELDWDGSLVKSWDIKGLNGQVRDMQFALDGKTIFVAGAFSKPRQSIVRVSSVTGALDGWAIPRGGVIVGDRDDPGMTCWSLVVTAARLYAGCGRRPNYVAAFRLDKGNTGSRVWYFDLVGNAQVISLMPDGKSLMMGGHFGTVLKQKVCGGKPLRNLGILNKIDTDHPSIDCDFLPFFDGRNPYAGVWEIQVTADYIWVGGGFETIDGVAHHGLARFTL